MAHRSAAAQQPKTVIYLYGITRSAPPDAVRAVGVDGLATLERLETAGLVCWISRVPSAAYGEALARNMKNLEWLAEAGVLHQRAVAAIAAASDILPARFGTVFRDEDSLARHVAAEQRAIKLGLKKVTGADEWGVKVFAEPRAAAAVSVDVRSGKEYLQRKAAMLPQRAASTAPAELAAFGKALAAVADDVAQGGPVSAGQRNLVWQGSFLVRRSRQKQWQAVLRRFASKWGEERRVESTGPWPPYSFARAQES